MAKVKTVSLPLTDKRELTSENYADVAKDIMQKYEKRDLTTSKLRGMYGQVMNVYTAINAPDEFDAHKGDIQYLKVKLAYEAGRERSVKAFLDGTRLMSLLDHVVDYDSFILYCRYAESLVAYFKFYGGRD